MTAGLPARRTAAGPLVALARGAEVAETAVVVYAHQARVALRIKEAVGEAEVEQFLRDCGPPR